MQKNFSALKTKTKIKKKKKTNLKEIPSNKNPSEFERKYFLSS